jgi:glycosyltransferase involved in cell wall biosynthesis
LPNLLVGGTQRVMTTAINHLSKERFDITLIVINSESLTYNGHHENAITLLDILDKEIEVINLKQKGVKYSILAIRNQIKKLKPDVVLSSLSYVNLYIAFFLPFLPKGVKYIARESNTLSVKHKNINAPKWMDWLYKKFYKRFDVIIAQSEDMYLDLIKNYNVLEENLIKINNPVDTATILSNAKEPKLYEKGTKNIVCVGHLSYQKGYDFLVSSLLNLEDHHWKCHVIGRDAGEMENIQKILEENPHLKEKIILHGFQSNPFNFLKNADLFVLSSRFEGFPNVMIEAGTYGLPIVAFDNPGGMAEILNDERLGILAKSNDTEDLSKCIHQALSNTYDKTYISQTYIKRFGLNTIIQKYEDVFK